MGMSFSFNYFIWDTLEEVGVSSTSPSKYRDSQGPANDDMVDLIVSKVSDVLDPVLVETIRDHLLLYLFLPWFRLFSRWCSGEPALEKVKLLVLFP